ncbi:MAG: hypothetical protein RML36_08565 [Anaerolineae bacterium]|nr:hypothetical protein [Anaerolineae bacterium]
MIKRTMKLAILGYERGREMAAHLAETVSDLAAEVEAETKSVQTSSSYIITPDRQSE